MRPRSSESRAYRRVPAASVSLMASAYLIGKRRVDDGGGGGSQDARRRAAHGSVRPRVGNDHPTALQITTFDGRTG